MSSRIPVTILGATGLVGQRFVRRLASHPAFEIRHLAASARSLGKPYGDACHWHLDGPSHAGRSAQLIEACDPDCTAAPVVFSALDADVARELERRSSAETRMEWALGVPPPQGLHGVAPQQR